MIRTQTASNWLTYMLNAYQYAEKTPHKFTVHLTKTSTDMRQLKGSRGFSGVITKICLNKNDKHDIKIITFLNYHLRPPGDQCRQVHK